MCTSVVWECGCHRTWAQIGIHCRPVGLLNTNGFFDGLLAFIKSAVDGGFIPHNAAELLLVSDDPVDLLDRMERHKPKEPMFQWPVKP